MEMNGKIYLFGDLNTPRLNGSLRSSILNSKFVFKGHEFFITYGKVDFISDLQDHGPLINFVAQSTVENYKVKLAVYGHASDMTIDLTSLPALSQQDILSLLTLGITSSDSSKLQEDDRSYLTSVGVGSLLADRFKINEGLKSSLGLNFTIAPELTQSGESLLPSQGTTSTGSSQYKSTTKLKVQKKVSELVDVSLASTVGSSQSQKQEINVNLNLSQNISVQGVYEVKSANEDTTEQTPGSLGLDLLFRKTFK
jgi:translocation and assembly module TamB